MKIYLMLGLPNEKESDLEELIALMKKVKAQIKEIRGEKSGRYSNHQPVF